MKPTQEAEQSMVSPSSSTLASRRPTLWSMIILSLIKRRRKLAKKFKGEIAKADPEDFGNTYGIDLLKIGKAKHNLNESK